MYLHDAKVKNQYPLLSFKLITISFQLNLVALTYAAVPLVLHGFQSDDHLCKSVQRCMLYFNLGREVPAAQVWTGPLNLVLSH